MCALSNGHDDPIEINPKDPIRIELNTTILYFPTKTYELINGSH